MKLMKIKKSIKINISRRILAVLVVLMLIMPYWPVLAVQTGGDSSLTVKVQETGTNDFVDVDDIGNEITWPLSYGTKQIQITANFGPAGVDKDRTINVNIPRGYRIREYSATSATPVISGVSKIDLSVTDDPKVTSSLLTAENGGAWDTQNITGYSGEYTQNNTNRRVYDGKIAYTFNNSCDRITLTITLSLDHTIMPHNATSTTLKNDIIVDMVSGTETLSTNLKTTVNQIAVPTIGGISSRSIECTVDPEDPNKGTTPEFITQYAIGITNSAVGNQSHLAEYLKIVVSYPEGVTFTGFRDYYITRSNSGGKTAVTAATFTSGIYANNHLTLTLDKVNRTVTFEFDKIWLSHITGGESITCYWKAEIDNDKIKWDRGLNFPATMNVETGFQADNPQTHNQVTTSGVTVTVKKPSVAIRITPQNYTRRDLNAYADQKYPYDYMLGQFLVENLGPSVARNLLYKLEFSPNLQVRGVALPGNLTEVQAVTNADRTITLSSPSNNIDSIKFGLAEGEYLVSLKAWQSSLSAAASNTYYTYSSVGYFGHFKNGQEGDVTLKISDVTNSANPVVYASAKDHTKIGWTTYGSSTTTLTAARINEADGTGTGSFYPGASIKFTSTTNTLSINTYTQNDAVDPVIYICLPEGINLDMSSVKAAAKSGNYDGAEFPLKPIGSSATTINGEPWNVYAFTSYEKLDMVAKADHGFTSPTLQPTGYNQITVTFIANVSTACKSYTGLKMQDVVRWDFGKTASFHSNSIDYRVLDAGNITGKGTSYYMGAATQSGTFHIVQKPALKVSIGIRTYEGAVNPNPFYTYNGTGASIAPVTVNAPAEIWLEWSNVDSTDFKVGSEIYLPIPKKDKAYDAYFNDIEPNPAAGDHDIKEPTWSGYLTGPVTLPSFTTFYTKDDVYATNSGEAVDNDWVPIDCVWISDTTEWTNDDYAAVTMMKFVANVDLPSGASGNTTFTLDIEPGAKLGDVDYWRSYQKGWRTEDGNGSWTFGSVIAAEPSMSGIQGMIFNDININGQKDGATEDYTYGNITAVLTEINGGILPLTLTINPADGSFKSLNANNTQYFLKTGEYLLTFDNNTSGKYGFTPESATPSEGEQTSSNGTVWKMDVQQDDIATTHDTATFSFVVDPTMSTDMTIYIGVGMRQSPVVTYKPGVGAAFTQSEVTVIYGRNPYNNPNNSEGNVQTGYNPDTMMWTIDKEVTLTNSDIISAGAPITTAQLRQIVVTEDIVATAGFTLRTYTVIYDANWSGAAGDGTVPADANNPYNHGSTVTVLGNSESLDKNGYIFLGWSTSSAATSAQYTDGSDFIITQNTTLYAVWEKLYILTYDLNDGGDTVDPANGNGGAETDELRAGDAISGAENYVKNSTGGTTIPTRTNYTFGGWYLEPECTTPVGATLMGGGNRTIYAKWTADSYVLTYNLNAGDADRNGGAAEDTVAYGELISNAANYIGNSGIYAPTRTGYIFGGWYLEPTCDTAAGGTVMPANNTTIYAKWEPELVTVLFYTNEDDELDDYSDSYGVGDDANTGKKYGDELTTFVDPVNSEDPGMIFVGWFTDRTGGSIWDFDTDTINVTGTLRLYARWQNAPTLIFHRNHSDASGYTEADPASITVTFGNPVGDLPGLAGEYEDGEPIREGYIFKGWSEQSGEDNTVDFDESYIVDFYTAKTVYAVWENKELTVRFYMNDGTSNQYSQYPMGSDENIGKIYGDKVSEPTDPNREGYIFGGWYKESGSINEWDFEDYELITANGVQENDGEYSLSLYAKWTPVYTVTYDANGGTGAPTDDTEYLLDGNVNVIFSPEPEKTGYIFLGWATDDEAETLVYSSAGTKSFIITVDTTLYAVWELEEEEEFYTITFIANGGTGTMASITNISAGEIKTLTPNAFTRSGYTFTGWNTAANGSGTPYANNGSVTVNGDIILYARWTSNDTGSNEPPVIPATTTTTEEVTTTTEEPTTTTEPSVDETPSDENATEEETEEDTIEETIEEPTEPENTTEPQTQQTIDEPTTTEEITTTELPTNPAISETSPQMPIMQRTEPTEPTTTADSVILPEGIELAEYEDFEELLNSAIPLANGWLAVDLGGDIWQIFDENFIPLGVFMMSDGEEIEDIDIEFIEMNLIPLAGVMTYEEAATAAIETIESGETAPEPVRDNPQTGDNIYVLLALLILAGVGMVTAITVKEKFAK